jgi:type I restriction enzyme M protein
MIGAIIGDIVGSRFEFDFNNIKTKDFEFFHEDCEWTDDSLMTVAVAAALMKWRDGGGA